MEINEFRPKHSRPHKAAVSEYEASQVKTQQINAPKQNQRPVNIGKNEQTTIKGEIIDLRYQDVKIKLVPSSQIISAKLSGELALSIGQTAEFVVTDETDGQITLRYIQEGNSPINDIIQKALYASGFTSSERNVAIVQELLKYQMPVDKNTILQLIKLTSTFSDVSTSTLVLMHKNGLPINAASLAQFEAYQMGMHQISKQLKALIGQINTIETNNTKSVINDIDSDIIDTNTNMPFNKNIAASNTNEAAFSGVTQNNTQIDNIQLEAILSNDIRSSNIQLDNVINLHKELLSLFIDGQGGKEEMYPDTTIAHILSDNELLQLQNTLTSEINESTYYSADMAENIKHQLLDGSMTLESLLEIVHDLYSDESSQPLPKLTMLPVRISSAFISMSPNLSDASKEKLVNILKTDNYRDTITEALHMRWTISPKELSKVNKVKDFYSRLERDMEGLDKLTDSLNISNLDIKSTINRLQDNLQFIRELNDLFMYIQLPIRLKEQDVHGDLYVFTHKNHKHRETENLNVLLHLDMVHLGSMDIHMSMKSHQVNAVFFLEKSSERIISQHLNELIGLLNDKGYQLQAKTQISDSKPDFINDILQQDAPSSITHRYSFDIRA